MGEIYTLLVVGKSYGISPLQLKLVSVCSKGPVTFYERGCTNFYGAWPSYLGCTGHHGGCIAYVAAPKGDTYDVIGSYFAAVSTLHLKFLMVEVYGKNCDKLCA